MDITQIYQEIIDRLNNAGFERISKDLDRLLDAASTGGEGLETSGAYLADLKKQNRIAYNLIENLVEKYKDYCKQYGIIID